MTTEPNKADAHFQRLKGRVAIVTGGNRGLGQAVSTELAREGADIAVVAGHNLEGANSVARQIEALGRRSKGLVADVTRGDVVRQMVDGVVAHFGRLDILVNCAGAGGVRKSLEQDSDDEWDRAFSINTKGTFLCSAAAANHMIRRRSGVIINIAGASAHRTYPRYGSFGPSKAAVLSLTRQASLEWAPYGIRVNGVSPGPIRDPDSGWQDREPELAKEVLLLPMQRAGTRREVARTVAYLASDDAGYVTGQTIIVDGGGANTWYLSASTSRRERDQAL